MFRKFLDYLAYRKTTEYIIRNNKKNKSVLYRKVTNDKKRKFVVYLVSVKKRFSSLVHYYYVYQYWEDNKIINEFFEKARYFENMYYYAALYGRKANDEILGPPPNYKIHGEDWLNYTNQGYFVYPNEDNYVSVLRRNK